MKQNKSTWVILGLLIIVGSVCRVAGFAPQIAMAVFGGVVLKDKRAAFLFPILSMLLSDAIYELLYLNGVFEYPGFYTGQISNYILIIALTFFGIWAKKRDWLGIATAVVAAPVTYFFLSNFLVWFGGGGYQRQKTFSGLLLCYQDGLPFLRSSLITTAIFSAILFGAYYLIQRFVLLPRQQQLS